MSEVSRNFSDTLKTPGITPVTHYGNFSGLVISVGENDEKTAARLLNLLERNNKAAVEEIRQLALNESEN